MSKKLVFTLKPIVSSLGSALEVHMHRGGSIHVEPFREAIYTLPADEDMTDEELLKWYGRYSTLGLETRIEDLPDTISILKPDDLPEVLVNPIPPSIPASGSQIDTPDVKQAKAESDPKPATEMFMEEHTEQVLHSADTEIISEVVYDTEDTQEELKTDEKPDFDSMSTSHLRDYAKEHGVQVADMRSRQQLLKALKNAD